MGPPVARNGGGIDFLKIEALWRKDWKVFVWDVDVVELPDQRIARHHQMIRLDQINAIQGG